MSPTAHTTDPAPASAPARWDAIRAWLRSTRERPWQVERDDALPLAARRFNVIMGLGLVVLTCVAFWDTGVLATPWPWLLMPVTVFMLTHRVSKPSGVSFTFSSPFMIGTVVYGPSVGLAIMVLAIPPLMLASNASWRMSARFLISTLACNMFTIWLVAGCTVLVDGWQSASELIALALAASLADHVSLIAYFAPLIRFVEGRSFSLRSMLREQWWPTTLQWFTELSTVTLGALCVTVTPLAWLLFIPPFAMLYRDSALVDARNELLERLATDELTGVRSRSGWFESVREQWVVPASRPSHVVMVDLDHFKMVNDQWGHSVGDEVLAMAARAMVSSLGDEGIVGRFGGEEFMLALRGSDREVHAACELLRSDVAAALARWGTTLSLGIATLGSIEQIDDAVDRADVAVYLAKQSGRDQLARYDDEIGPLLASGDA